MCRGGLATRTRTKAEVATRSLTEAVVDRGNLMLAYQRVVENKWAAGVDQLAVSELKDHLKRHWPTIRARLLAGIISTAAGARGEHSQTARRAGVAAAVQCFAQRRGHVFCRYADDCIYVGSERAGAELLHSLTRFLDERSSFG